MIILRGAPPAPPVCPGWVWGCGWRWGYHHCQSHHTESPAPGLVTPTCLVIAADGEMMRVLTNINPRCKSRYTPRHVCIPCLSPLPRTLRGRWQLQNVIRPGETGFIRTSRPLQLDASVFHSPYNRGLTASCESRPRALLGSVLVVCCAHSSLGTGTREGSAT